jgi:CheY-like chemotaxis protein
MACGITGGKQVREMMEAETEYPNVRSDEGAAPIRQTILLVEDEEMVRALMREVLEREGYEVLPCAHPKEGIEMSQRHGGRIDLLLTDVVMPGMNGQEMANQILERLPELQVVFMSGYTEQVLMQEGEVEKHFEYLQKPFTLRSLTRKLAQLLGGAAGRMQ